MNSIEFSCYFVPTEDMQVLDSFLEEKTQQKIVKEKKSKQKEFFPLLEIPSNDIILHILSFLPFKDMQSTLMTCRSLNHKKINLIKMPFYIQIENQLIMKLFSTVEAVSNSVKNLRQSVFYLTNPQTLEDKVNAACQKARKKLESFLCYLNSNSPMMEKIDEKGKLKIQANDLLNNFKQFIELSEYCKDERMRDVYLYQSTLMYLDSTRLTNSEENHSFQLNIKNIIKKVAKEIKKKLPKL